MIRKFIVLILVAFAIIFIYRSISAPDNSYRTSPVKGLSIKEIPVLQQNSQEKWPFEAEGGMQKMFPNEVTNWTKVREEDGGNCGYHAIKNVITAVQSLDATGTINDVALRQMQDKKTFWSGISFQAPEIAANRLENVQKELKKRGISVDDISPDYLKDVRSKLNFLKDYVNSNDGHVKTDFLSGDEIEQLLKHYPNKVAVIEYNPDLIGAGLPLADHATMQKINDFKMGRLNHLGIIWNESGYNHWVGYVASRHPVSRAITVYRFNSKKNSNPQHEQAVVDMVTL